MGVPVHQGKRGKYNNAKTGKFLPQHPEKYKGKNLPIFKSSLEQRLMLYLDSNPYIISWQYEPIAIKYLDKSSRPPRIRRYFIDFIAVVKQGLLTKTIWLEVKPLREAQKPKNSKNIMDNLIWLKNNCKWDAARQMAKSKGYEFHIITEEQLN